MEETGDLFMYFTQGVAVTEVEVDTLTGDHTVLRVDIHVRGYIVSLASMHTQMVYMTDGRRKIIKPCH
jgi:xanthine dehydrogenase molybdopterin-binding subunit B